VSYSYDRRRGVTADDTTAMRPRDTKMQPIVPYEERNDALKHLSEFGWMMKEWVIRSNPDAAIGPEHGATHETYATMDKLRDEFHEFQQKIQHLGAYPGRREPIR
jgi:hypothetical protein